ncbi:Glycoside hydrolase family 16 (Modular protein) [Frankia sp. AiPs1]|uniref:glycoside hydrolase family 16 protein n=1 Tax=Frankia sp. AiPa1 TaxID=573492 RepID=UPI00202B56B4|nr:glycoside hydrolase family 16 protein [Frankia sp. AiPa1]MCL9761637.1 glycoside hydrolase family 16 protein [Frankia sp. AiPa1]
MLLTVVAGLTLAFGLAPAAVAAPDGGSSPSPTPSQPSVTQPPTPPTPAAQPSVTQTSAGVVAGVSAAATGSAARLVLAVFEQDIVLVGAHGFPAGASVSLSATTGDLQGTTTTKADADGRLIVGFLVPAGYNGTVSVTATAGTTTATGSLAVTVAADAPHATASSAAWAPGVGATPSAAGSTPTPSPSVSSAPSPSAPAASPSASPALTPASSASSAKAATSGGATQPTGPTSPAGWKLSFGDDFDGPTLDQTKWSLCNPSFSTLCKPYNNEKEIFNTAATGNANVSVANGALHLTATRDADGQIRSGMVSSGPWPASFGPAPAGYKPFSYTYGYYESRVRIPRGNGFWPSVWELPVSSAGGGKGWPDTGEMDVFEIPGNTPTEYHFTAHWGGIGVCGHPCSPQQTTIPDASANWHVFGLDWEPDGLTWYLDGAKVGRTVNDAGAVKNAPFYLLANLSVGGDWAPLGKGVDASTPFPSSLDIDWLRVYQHN